MAVSTVSQRSLLGWNVSVAAERNQIPETLYDVESLWSANDITNVLEKKLNLHSLAFGTSNT